MENIYNEKIVRRNKKTENKIQPDILVISNFDYVVFVCVLLLVLVGIVMVFSSSYYDEAVKIIRNPDSSADIFRYLKRQGLFAVLGFISMMIMANFNYKHLKKYSTIIYLSGIFFLILVLLIGKEIKGAKRWIDLGFFNFQPSEYAKFGIIVHMSHMLSKYKKMLNSIFGYLVVGFILAIPVILIGIENGSTALILAIIGAGLIFIVSPHTLIIVVGGLTSFALGIIGLVFFTEKFRLARFYAWLDPFSDPIYTGFQIIQSLYAVASGGLFGLGLGQSRQKLGYLPEAQNDMIFSIICEELGFFGASFILLLFIVLIWRGIKIAINASDLFGTLLASGIIIIFGIQAIINVSVATNTIPNTGVPLPFISYGGTALIVFMAMAGVLLNISRYSKD